VSIAYAILVSVPYHRRLSIPRRTVSPIFALALLESKQLHPGSQYFI
jgi:hypothetical protein